MSYKDGLEAAGAVVIAYREFGSYQGDWWAFVEHCGKRFWVAGCFGSCSGCDAFEAEFGDRHQESCEDHAYESERDRIGCKACKKAAAEYAQALADFGQRYLDDPLTPEEAEKKAAEHIEWDPDAEAMLAFIQRVGGKQ